MTDRDLRAKLSAPIKDFKWRLQQTMPKDARRPYPPGTRGLFMAYIDARDVYDRLDDVFGVGNWSRTIIQVNPDGSVVGEIKVRTDSEWWVEHQDIGYSNDPGASHEKEPLKAAASDAFKRAAVGLGIGRFLYELDARWVEIDEWGKPRADLGTGEVKPQKQAELPPRTRTTTQNPIPRDFAPEPEMEGAASWTVFWDEARRAGLQNWDAIAAAGIGTKETELPVVLAALRAKVGGGPELPEIDFASTRGRRMADASDERPMGSAEQTATPKQLKFIQALSREYGMDDDEVSNEVEQLYGCRVALLSRRDASAYIERLQSRRNVTEIAS
jgi:hypothetical protein